MGEEDLIIWQYNIFHQLKKFGPLSIDTLNKLGGDGWSLVAIMDYESYWHYVFKRRAGLKEQVSA